MRLPLIARLLLCLLVAPHPVIGQGGPAPVYRDAHAPLEVRVRDLLATTVRPVIQLEGFQRIQLAPGEEREVVFHLGPNQLHLLNQQMQWVVEPGTFRVMIGSSSKDIRLRGELTVR